MVLLDSPSGCIQSPSRFRYGLLLIVLGTLPAAAGSLSDVRGRLETARKTWQALQSVRDELNRQLADIERRQGELARTIAVLEAQAVARRTRILELKRRQEELQGSIRRQQRMLKGQLRSAHVVGRKDWLKLLLNQEDPSRLARVLAYYGYLNQARIHMIQRWRSDLGEARELEAELDREAAAQEETRAQTQRERSALLQSTEARRRLLSTWDIELKSQAASIVQLKEDEQRLEALIENVDPAGQQRNPSSGQGLGLQEAAQGEPKPAGKICPPGGGPVLAGFGTPRLSAKWDGVLLGGREGDPVRAVASGRVVFADWFRGYGLLMIVSHENGTMSLYAFSQTLYKSKGDRVSAGEVISTIGTSGGRDKPGLYFGIRRGGQPVDPLLWCAGRA